MKIRQARKIISGHISQRMRRRLNKLHRPYINEQGNVVHKSWHKYHRIHEAWVVVYRKIRKYGDKFKLL